LLKLRIVTDDAMRPITAGLWKYIGANVTKWNLAMALPALEILPPTALFLIAQRDVVAGLTAGSVK
jgi:multiple sugar transport system permease protein